ncbi:hypothetical protein [Idiomarina sp.]|uniref:hypothetical protein n=1 Tax=Idiomarina sp. TaxID=1874361 RepID=UPI003A91E1B0
MYKHIFFIASVLLLSACGATKPEPYEKDVSPENREKYSGAEGMEQYQKDQSYIMSKELADKCASAKMEFLIAESEENTKEMEKQKEIIEDTCV